MENEKRLIDANALKTALRTKAGAAALGHSVYKLFAVDEIIDAQPAVDCVEVVRCKDCDFACEGNYGLVCTAWGARTDENMFCGNGERKDNGKE